MKLTRTLFGQRKRRQTRSYGSENLEERVLLSATLTDGVLSVQGTADDDAIRVTQDDDNLIVTVNGEESTFVAADVTAISIDAGAGNDSAAIQWKIETPATLNGGDGNDALRGGRGADVIDGGAGRDRLRGGGGDDQIDGGDGNDRIWGEHGADVINGDGGNDRVLGGSNHDTMSGGDGRDRMNGGGGDDNLDGGAGADALNGGRGDDVIAGGEGADQIRGGSGNDMLDGGDGSDRLNGDRGEDVLLGGDGNDRLKGNSEVDVLDGGEGTNLIHDKATDGPTQEEIEAFVAARATELFARLDENMDGGVTEDEVSESIWERLTAADTDLDSAVSEAELVAHFLARIGSRGPGESAA